jgi:hypothetical protein
MKAIILFLLVLSVYSCSSNPFTTEDVKDPKQYVWSVDSLKSTDPTMVQCILGSIWGSSEKDVYAVGHGDAENPIMHYDGQSWKELDKLSLGMRYSFNPTWIYGFASNDIFLAGSSAAIDNYGVTRSYATIYHYTGHEWEINEIHAEIELSSLWGKNATDIWACGPHGLVVNYDGIKWNIDTIKISAGYSTSFFLYSVIRFNGKVYALGYKNENHTDYFFEKTENGWITKDSYIIGSIEDKWGDDFFFLTSDNRLFSYGHDGVWEYDGNIWTKIITTDYLITGITEYAKGKFIVVDYNGKVYTYIDGVQELLKDFGGNPYLYNIWANNKECFILANKFGGGLYASSLIYHGK